MFGLIRICVLVLCAFVGGIFFERSQAREACQAQGGLIENGMCRGVQ
jgi:hypothetical protein